MTDHFRDHEDRNRFELDVEGTTAFVTYRKSPDAITLVHTEVPPELGGRDVGSKLGRATLDSVRSQGRKLHVECDFVRNFMAKHAEYNDLLAHGEAKKTDTATYKAGRTSPSSARASASRPAASPPSPNWTGRCAGLRRARTAPDRGDRPPGVPAPVRRGLVTLPSACALMS